MHGCRTAAGAPAGERDNLRLDNLHDYDIDHADDQSDRHYYVHDNDDDPDGHHVAHNHIHHLRRPSRRPPPRSAQRRRPPHHPIHHLDDSVDCGHDIAIGADGSDCRGGSGQSRADDDSLAPLNKRALLAPRQAGPLRVARIGIPGLLGAQARRMADLTAILGTKTTLTRSSASPRGVLHLRTIPPTSRRPGSPCPAEPGRHGAVAVR